MSDDVKKYFFEKYKKANFRVVPGHWPDFKNIEEVDKWFELMRKISKAFNE
jgi:hypothetical protein